ncbi:MAG TPA: PEGA domain-containing protein [Kofleriaceae bacterium]|nr:PEGA domain-containing protein [Kofleriaceae bacterium]
MCVGVACGGVALAQPIDAAPVAPKVDARELLKEATKQYDSGNYEKALELAEQGLAAAPKDRKLLVLKDRARDRAREKQGNALFDKARKLREQRDYAGALDAYDAFLKVGKRGNKHDVASDAVKDLSPARTTSIEITVTNGPADIFIETRTLGAICANATSCKKAWLPGNHDVFAETRRPGFKRWSGSITVQNGQAAKLSITLDQDPSQLTVRATPPEATVTVDGAPYDASKPLAAGKHTVVVSLAEHKGETREIVAAEGKPIELDVALQPLPPAVAAPGPVGPVDPEPTIFTGRRKIALAAGGAGVVALGVGVALGLSAKGLDDDAYALCESPSVPCLDAVEANDLNERARSRALGANIAFGVAGGAAIAAAVLWFTGAPESRSPRRVAVTPRLGGGAGLDVAVRF